MNKEINKKNSEIKKKSRWSWENIGVAILVVIVIRLIGFLGGIAIRLLVGVHIKKLKHNLETWWQY